MRLGWVTSAAIFYLLTLAAVSSASVNGHRKLANTGPFTDDDVETILKGHPSKKVAEFVSFVDKYNKTYTTVEEVKHRYTVFTANVEYIEEHNKEQSSYKLGINEWTDLTSAEFAAAHGMPAKGPRVGLTGP